MNLSFRRTLFRRNVIVNTGDGRAFKGILWDQAGPLLVLRNVEMLEPGVPDPMPVDGEVVIERVKVDFIQVL